MIINNNISDLHPLMRDPIARLTDLLHNGFANGKTLTEFRLFETYRSPERQASVLEAGTSKAHQWQSAHQVGLAADFAARVNGLNGPVWSWNDHLDWAFLKSQAQRVGLDVPISWDKGHVEHPAFQQLRTALRR